MGRCGVAVRADCGWLGHALSILVPARCARRVGQDGSLVRFGDDLVGSGVEHLNGLGSDELLGRHMKAVGVALDGVEQPGSRVAEPSQHGGG